MLPRPVRLLDSPRAPNPRRLRIFLAEKGLSLPAEEVDIMAGAHRRPEYLARVGAPTVPAVELEDGTVLTETVAIFRYLEAVQPEPDLLGRDPLETAVIEMWHRRLEFGLLQQVAAVVRHLNPRMAALESPQVPAWGEANRARVEASLRDLDRRLAASPWVAGDRFTVADITPFVVIDFMRVARIPVAAEWTHLRRWLAAMRARESVAG